MAANPIGLLLSGIAALVTLIITFTQKTENLTQKRSVLNDVQKEAVKKAAEEIEVVKRLHQIVRNSNEAYDTRRKAIEHLQKIVPGYHASLTKEGKLTEHNTKAISDYIRSLQNKALAEAAYDKLVELQKARIEQQMTVERKKYNVRAVDRELKKKQYESRTQRAVMYSPSTESTDPMDPIEYELNDLRTKKLNERQKQVDALNAAQTELNETTKQINQLNNFVQGNNEVKSFYGKLINNKATDFPPTTPKAAPTRPPAQVERPATRRKPRKTSSRKRSWRTERNTSNRSTNCNTRRTTNSKCSSRKGSSPPKSTTPPWQRTTRKR